VDAPAGASDSDSTVAKIVLAVLLVLVVTAVTGLIAWELTSPPEQLGPVPPAPSPRTAAPEAPSAAPNAPAPSGKPAERAAPPALRKPSTRKQQGASACFAALLPADAFGERAPDLDACCRGTDAYDRMLKLKTEVVRTGRAEPTEAMQEWSRLGWYETAAFAVMRAHCCPDAAALEAPRVVSRCKMDEALAWLANALDDPRAMSEAVRAFGAAAECISDKGRPDLFGRSGPPNGGEIVFLGNVIERVRKARSPG
jgi:hypothetical protein